MEEKRDIKALSYEEVLTFAEELGEKKFRGKQLYEWMHVHNVASYDEMTNLPKKFREVLKEQTTYTALEQIDCQISREDGTQQVSLCSSGRQYGRKRSDALSPWKFGLCFLTGGLSHGLSLLCIDSGWAGQKPDTIGDP